MKQATVAFGWLAAEWGRAPTVVRLTAVIAPLLFAACAHGLIPPSSMPGGQAGAGTLVASQWKEINSRLQRRAGLALKDDFRGSLKEWRSRSNAPAQWSHDAAGFVQPGRMALYRPTIDLTDYRLEFQAQVDQRGLGVAFRASDWDNFYAVRLVIAEPGPLPKVQVVRYSVVHGREGPHTVHLLPFTVRSDTTYRVQIEVRGGEFTLITQGKVADYWSDSRLTRGGVGFFCERGERASLEWVEVSHQYDVLGKLCAYLAPLRPLNSRESGITIGEAR